MHHYVLATVSILALHSSLAAAHGSMDSLAGNMLPYLHFTSGDNMWFLGWVPKSAGAMVGTCIGLFMLGLIDRWISACVSVMGSHWDKRSQILQSNSHPITATKSALKRPTSSQISSVSYLHYSPPFIPSHDLARGVIYAVQSVLRFALMLVIMTYNIGFILSIIFGSGVGEMLFGRFAAHRVR